MTSSGLIYPLGTVGQICDKPADHAGRSQSNSYTDINAVDIAVPKGTPVYAVEKGTLGKVSDKTSQGPDYKGWAINLFPEDKSNAYYYGHLSSLAPGIQTGSSVEKGQLLGYSGDANGLDHLHFACKNGDPVNLLAGATVVTNISRPLDQQEQPQPQEQEEEQPQEQEEEQPQEQEEEQPQPQPQEQEEEQPQEQEEEQPQPQEQEEEQPQEQEEEQPQPQEQEEEQPQEQEEEQEQEQQDMGF